MISQPRSGEQVMDVTTLTSRVLLMLAMGSAVARSLAISELETVCGLFVIAWLFFREIKLK
jgi:uncharacterized membrane protein YGL010W